MNFKWIFVAISMVLGLSAAGYGDRMSNGTYYDLGISLSSGYGTISAHMLPRSFRGATMKNSKFYNNKDPLTEITTNFYIDIAKIDGGETYKNYMLGLHNETQTIVAPTFCPFSDRVCQWWPIRTVQPVNPIAPMLKALITAAGTTLETKINSVAVTVYDTKSIDIESTRRHVSSALNQLQIAGHDFLGHSAAITANALGMHSRCQYTPPGLSNVASKDPEQLVLSVEFTRDSLSTALWLENCQEMQLRQSTQSSKLGHRAMELSGASEDSTKRWEKNVKSVLDYICGNTRRRNQERIDAVLSQQTGLGPVLDYESVGGKAIHENIDAVLLTGENAGDEKMQSLLRKVLTQQFANGHSVDFSRTEDISSDPAFVGSRAAAWDEGNIQRAWRSERDREICDRNAKLGLGCWFY